MGLWSFTKDAGASLFGKKKEEAAKPAETAAAPQTDFAKQAEALQAELAKFNLDKSGLDVKVSGDKVTLSGKAASPEIKEKVILAVGNVQGVAQVETEDDEDGEAPVFYTVKKGDTLSAIAKATLGNANRYNDIFEANKPMLSHPDKIYPGQNLRIPR